MDHNHMATPRLIAWEVTRTCNLSCIHCRAASINAPYSGELSTEEAIGLIDNIGLVWKPILILTGGEPLLRKDIFEIAHYSSQKGCRVTMATNGTLVDPEIAKDMKRSGIQRVSISLDGSSAENHDRFRQMPGAFEGALKGIEILKSAGIPFQINTTITSSNYEELPKIHALAIKLGAVAHHIFLLVPTGRGRDMAGEELLPEVYENILHWFYDQRGKSPLQLKATCAPHYYRILRERARERGEKVTVETYGLDAMTRGCLAGTGFCFISHLGDVQPCGYLEVSCGNVREKPFGEIWENSDVFRRLRDFSAYEGKCGKCEYIRVCGGCRARAYEATGNFMAEEPLCSYIPSSLRKRGDNSL
ncbi:MAG: heme b synthase [Syntrophobacterales bacterium]|nr:heme b synthase [Syntrophobacterales bacterium]